jgi:hypothetical protein
MVGYGKQVEKDVRNLTFWKEGLNSGASAYLTACTLLLLSLLEPDYLAKTALLLGKLFWVKRQFFWNFFYGET